MTAACGPTLLERIKTIILAEPDLCAQAIADRCGCSRSTVSMARGQLGLRKWRWARKQHITAQQDVDTGIRKCVCGLRLLSPQQLAQGHCDNCPRSAVNFMGRRDDQVIGATGW